ncbi:hypothetical protein [Lentzea pudingi]|uniref:hypothetical protein n=1 Tax=Lentzea pudingi TaxID=1789439 RepID=UPI001664C758|nr:hypothetical protein [Lentzea pudingi]
MTRTPIFDELYAKYVAGAPARDVPAPPTTTPAVEPPVPTSYAWTHQAPQWPAEN